MKDLEVKKYVNKEGLRLIEVPFSSTGAVSVLVLVKAGSRFEINKKWGLAHFLEHMFFKGGEKYKNTKEVSEAIDRVGGSFNAFTDKEEVGFFIKLPGEKVELALDILSDMLLKSKFKEEDIDREKRVIIEEYNMYEDSPMYQTTELLESILFKGTALERKIIGEKDTILNITRKDFLDYTGKNYFPQNVVIVLVGDTSKVDKEMVYKYFNYKIKKKPTVKKINKYKPLTDLKIKFKETEQSHFSLGFLMSECTYQHKDFFATRVLSVILGEGMSSRAFLEVREKRGLAYRVSSTVHSFTDTGFIEMDAGVDTKRIKEAIKALIKEFNKLKEKKIGIKELNKAKEYIKGKLILGLEESLDTAFFVGRQELLSGKISNISEIYKKIDKVTAEDILRISKKDFIKKALSLAIIGPFKDSKEFKEILNNF